MAKTDRRRPEDRSEATRIALAGLAAGTDPRDLVLQLDALHSKGSLFPGSCCWSSRPMLEFSGASRADPVEYDGIRERHLPEIDIRGKYQHRKSHCTLRAVAMIRAGVAPDLEAEVSCGAPMTSTSWRSARSSSTCGSPPTAPANPSTRSANASQRSAALS